MIPGGGGGFGSGTLGGLADLADLHVDTATQPFLCISWGSVLEHLTSGLPHAPFYPPFFCLCTILW